MSIIRVGLGETKKFAEGYEAIFGKKSPAKDGEGAKRTTSPKKKKGVSVKKRSKKK